MTEPALGGREVVPVWDTAISGKRNNPIPAISVQAVMAIRMVRLPQECIP
jgi:hypothetical protein